jgi:prolyl-tRNA editing enzyme YbaK/EbsC (Cys-tRNA(Pro) deacylase)
LKQPKQSAAWLGRLPNQLVFKTRDTQQPILVIASGANRVDELKIGAHLDEPIGKADADFVRSHTGFVIGGVPPVGHIEAIKTFIDEDLLTFEQIWAAAGTPHAVFPLKPADLVQITNGAVIQVRVTD